MPTNGPSFSVHSDGPINILALDTQYESPGHHYAVFKDSVDDTNLLGKIDFQDGVVPEVGVNGVTNEALIAILIDRTKKLNAKFPSQYNLDAIAFLNGALRSFNDRTLSRKARGVEGKHVA